MKVSITLKNSIALISLCFIMQETHELAHTGVGRIICGCWGERDFNLWGLCTGCSDEQPLALLATYAGPAYSFLIIWIGYFLLFKPWPKVKSLGFALIVCSMPFSRIVTPLFGGGDTIYALNRQWNNHGLAWAVGLTLVLLLLIPPVIKMFKAIGNKRRLAWFIALLFVPFIITGAVVLGLMQFLLGNGVLDSYGIMGSPILVTMWFAISVLVFILFSKHILVILQPEDNSELTSIKK